MRSIAIVVIVLLMSYLNDVHAQVQTDTASVIIDTIANPISQSIDTIPAHDTHDTIIELKEDEQKGLDVIKYLFPKDSLDVYRYSFYPDDSINYINLQYLDTANHTTSEYNMVRKLDYSFNDLGPIASAHQNQIFAPSSQLGFQYGIHSFDAFLWKNDDLNLYDNRSPYTKIFYLMGSKKENILKLSHAQSFLNQRITAQFDFQLFNHLGFYERQHTDTKSFKGGMGYRTEDRRYRVNFQYYHNKLLMEENGGIIDLLDFEEDRETNRQIIPVNLENADNFVRISGISVMQDFYLSEAEPDLSQIPDTNLIEYEAYSVIHYKKPWFAPVSHFGKISYRFNYQRENYQYTDKDQTSDLYNKIPVYEAKGDSFSYYTLPFYPTADSSEIFDSITVRKYTNELIYSNSDYKDDPSKPKFINYFFGIRNDFTYYHQACFDERNMNHNALIGGVFVNLSKFMSVSGDAAYYVGDYANNDFQINGKLFLQLKGNKLSGGIEIVHRSPDFIYQDFTSSRLRWSNDFVKTDQQLLFVKFERKNLWASVKVLNISNHLYFDEQYQPQQIGDNIQHIVIEARKDVRLGNWGGDFKITYQTVSNTEVIRIPDFSGKARIFYHNFFFNNVLDLELGIEAFYFTKYYADRYLPLLRSWHIQNIQEIGAYPFMDVFLNAKIGRARLFVRYENFNANFMENTYYASPSYPGLDPMFRFGASWILFN